MTRSLLAATGLRVVSWLFGYGGGGSGNPSSSTPLASRCPLRLQSDYLALALSDQTDNFTIAGACSGTAVESRLGETSVAHQPKGKDIHVIADNLSAHKTKQVEQFLVEHANVPMHFTPTYSSWLNQVELWFGKIERHVIARGVFTSVPDLRRKLMRYIHQYNKQPKPVSGKYFDPSRRIASA